MGAITNMGICVRCREFFGGGERCRNCGVHRDRTVMRIRRRSRAGGKRGRNSGKVSQHGKK